MIMKESVENSRRDVQSILLEWDQPDAPLAPLLTLQRHTIFDMLDEESDLTGGSYSHVNELPNPLSKQENAVGVSSAEATSVEIHEKNIESFTEAFQYYETLEEEFCSKMTLPVMDYVQELKNSDRSCSDLLKKVELAITSLNKLTDQYQTVSSHTNRLHNVCQKIVEEQGRLEDLHREISERLFFFDSVKECESKLESPAHSVVSKSFTQILDNLDNAIEFLKKNDTFKEAPDYLLRCHVLLSRSVNSIRIHIVNVFENTAQQVMTEAENRHDRDATVALFYGKFQASASKIKPLISSVECRVDKTQEYEHLLFDCHQSYFTQREKLLSSSISASIQELCKTINDRPTLVRSSCAFIIHMCQDEYKLFYHFFSRDTPHLISYLRRLCVVLYDMLRPLIIHIYHLETLEEICSIFRVEMLEEIVESNLPQLEAFGHTVTQILEDVQERIVYRAHCYFQSDILNFQPSPGDLAYPEKLAMMENIALSLKEQPAPLKFTRDLSSSVSSVASSTSQEVARITGEDSSIEQPYLSYTGNSPADLHGMWYPTVRRALTCLSRLYRCVERSVFQGLSQEALSMCIKSLSHASGIISSNKTMVDGKLFEIKHLLILREQTAPFQVDFTIKEMSVDFSQMRTAAFSLIQKRNRLFSISSSNALLEFLLEGTPQVKESLIDARKEIDQQLKSSCEMFIRHVTQLLAGPLLNFLETVQKLSAEHSEASSSNVSLAQQPYAVPSKIASVVQDTHQALKLKLPTVHRAMQLYLSNRHTEFILFKPIKNNIIANFAQLQQLLSSGGYSEDDLLLIGCPSPEQISVLLSFTSLSEGYAGNTAEDTASTT